MEKKNILFCGSGVVNNYELLDKLKAWYEEKGYNVSIITDCIEPGMSIEDWDYYMFGMIDRTDECLFIVPDTYTISKRINKTDKDIYNYSMTSRHLIYAANQCKEITWYNIPKDYITRNFGYSVYTCLHRIAFDFIISWRRIKPDNSDDELKLDEACFYHDIDKLIMYQIMDKESASDYHRKNNPHHMECEEYKNRYHKLETIVDWECSALTKPDKPLNALGTLNAYYSDSKLYNDLLSLIDSLGIRKPETLTEEDRRIFSDYSYGEIAKDGLSIKLNGKQCITPEYIVNEIKTHLYHPED